MGPVSLQTQQSPGSHFAFLLSWTRPFAPLSLGRTVALGHPGPFSVFLSAVSPAGFPLGKQLLSQHPETCVFFCCNFLHLRHFLGAVSCILRYKVHHGEL